MSELLEKELQHLSRILENIEYTVYGNGKQGLKADLIELRTRIETFKRIAVWHNKVDNYLNLISDLKVLGFPSDWETYEPWK